MNEQPMRARDPIGHSAIQPWSAGKLFPAVIAVIERNCAQRNDCGVAACARAGLCCYPSRSYELTIAGYVEEFASREDAERVAAYVCQNGRINPARYAELLGDVAGPADAFADAYCNGCRDEN